jgi:hypothetical protein
MTFYTLNPHPPALGLDIEERHALAALARAATAIAPFVRPALMIRLQLAGILVGYLLAALAIAVGLLSSFGGVR